MPISAAAQNWSALSHAIVRDLDMNSVQHGEEYGNPPQIVRQDSTIGTYGER